MRREETDSQLDRSAPSQDLSANRLDGQMCRRGGPAWFMPCVLALADLLLLAAVWPLCVELRMWLGGVLSPVSYLDLLPLVALVHVVLNAFLGSYNILLSAPIELKKCTIGTALLVLTLTAATFWVRPISSYSRGILLMGGGILFVALPAMRIAVRAYCQSRPWWGYKTVFYVNGDPGPERLRSVLKSLSPSLRPSLLIFHQADSPSAGTDFGVPAVHGTALLWQGARTYPDAVFVVLLGKTEAREGITETLDQAARTFGRTILLHESLSLGNLWARTVDLGNMLGLEAMQRLLDRKRMSLKTAMDIFISAVLLVLLSPVFALIMLCIFVERPGPFFYAHPRVGRGGRAFRALKFRTMYPDSSAVLEAALAADPGMRREWEERRKLANDPRITKVGRFLRRSSLDELPQLVNVLRGEMSLIGPRPITETEIPEYKGQFEFVNQVRPGLTGLWQVSGRSRLTYAERVELDVYYIRNWSIWLDMVILLKTPAAVLDFSGTA
jgi:Undecaprenyl-phosphate galactose phosphotransferase WbaP